MTTTCKEIVTSSYEKMAKEKFFWNDLNMSPSIFYAYLCNYLRKRKDHSCKFHQQYRFLYRCMWLQDHKILWIEKIRVITKTFIIYHHLMEDSKHLLELKWNSIPNWSIIFNYREIVIMFYQFPMCGELKLSMGEIHFSPWKGLGH